MYYLCTFFDHSLFTLRLIEHWCYNTIRILHLRPADPSQHDPIICKKQPLRMFFKISFFYDESIHKYGQWWCCVEHISPTDTSQETEDRAKLQRGWLGSQGICGWRSLMPWYTLIWYVWGFPSESVTWENYQKKITPRKLNVAPENRPSQQESSLSTTIFLSYVI